MCGEKTMKTRPYKKRSAQIFIGVCLGMGMVEVAACSSSESPQGGQRVQFGYWAGADAADAGTDGMTPRRNVPLLGWGDQMDAGSVDAADAGDGMDPCVANHPTDFWQKCSLYGDSVGKQGIIHEPKSDFVEREWGTTLTPEERTMVNTCPRRAWSKNVPDRDCTKDDECGDGICDRGHCSAIYSCLNEPGAPCKTDTHCSGVCMEGRCRSCVSDAECQRKTKNPFEACAAPRSNRPWRYCGSSRSVRPDELPALKAHCDAAPADKKPPYCPEP